MLKYANVFCCFFLFRYVVSFFDGNYRFNRKLMGIGLNVNE